MPLRNGSLQILPRNTVIRFAGPAANRRMGNVESILLDQDNTTGQVRIQFTNQFGYREIRTVPSTWIEANPGAIVAAQQGIVGAAGSNFGGTPNISPS